MHPCAKFQSFWRASVFGAKFAQKTLYGGVLRQTQPDNNSF